ncbi:MAG: flavodoxin family protein [Clostridia bacterium]|nr:flavodoxin family protein [Clostridia bacterium]
MSVIMLNGSPHKEGCTYTALTIIAKELKDQGIDSEIIWLGNEPVRGCTGCMGCKETAKCIYNDDAVNAIAERLRSAEGYIFGAAVHYASPNGNMVAAMDRLFYSAGRYMKNKPAAAVVSARRAGTTASLEVLNKYITINNMIMVPSTYWNMVHGSRAEDVLKDEEGVSVMRAIGSNMAWLVKLLRSAKGTELESPVAIPKARTNFIR